MGSRGGRVRRGLMTAALLAACSRQGGCVGSDAPGPPSFVDAREFDADPGGESTFSLTVFIFFNATGANRSTPSATDLFVAVYDYTDELVTGATVEASWEGEAAVSVPEVDVGYYALQLDGFVRTIEVDIQRGPDYLRDVRLEMPPLHSFSVDPSSLFSGVPLKIRWEPNRDPRVIEPFLYVATVDPFDVIYFGEGLTDEGSYESPDSPFSAAGRYEVGLSRDIDVRLNSSYSSAFVGTLVYEEFDVAWGPGDAGPIDAPVPQDAIGPDGVTLDGSPVDGVADSSMPD